MIVAVNQNCRAGDSAHYLPDVSCRGMVLCVLLDAGGGVNYHPITSGQGETSMPDGTIQELADYQKSGFWGDFSGSTSRWFDMAANGGVLQYNVTGFAEDTNGLRADRQEMAREAFKVFGELLGIDFQETTSTGPDVDFLFKDTDAGRAYCATSLDSGKGGSINVNTINVAANWQGGESGFDSYTFQTFLHEIGHGLGLGHQGDYNVGGTITQTWDNDSWQLAMMSYFSQNSSSTHDSYAFLLGPMAVDLLALDDLYGDQGFGVDNAFTSDTVWGFNTNITDGAYSRIAEFADDMAFCIVDGGGYDTLDFSGFSVGQKIDLTVVKASSTVASFSNIGGHLGNMSLAVGTQIEKAIGGSGNDTIIGNGIDNVLQGGQGDDIRRGKGGSDTLIGGLGFDTLIGGGAPDIFEFNFKKDSLYGSGHIDELRAGDGGKAFDGAGEALGDIFDFEGFGDLKFGGTSKGCIYLKDVGNVTHCYINLNKNAAPEVDIAIFDGAVKAAAYNASDFDFV
jgi:Ca2+-binding RTX toxin-like protein